MRMLMPQILNQVNFRKFFKTRKSPPSNILTEFEEKIWELSISIKYKDHPNRKDAYLREVNIELKNNSGVIIQSDKTRNLYNMSIEKYDQLLERNL